jgi:Flp pilus assembly protein CpaB
MNAKALIPLIAGLGIGGLALKLGFDTIKRAQGGQARPVETVEVWAAAQDIPRAGEITEEMLQPVNYPAALVPPGAFQTKEDLIGRVPAMVAPAGLPVLETMLSPPGTRPGLHVPPGFRAVAIKIDAGSGVDYHLEPGAFVDVVGSFVIQRNGRRETIARTVIENAELAAVGPRLSPSSGPEEDGDARHRSVRAVTLFVPPEDVKTLLLAEQKGNIKLGLRGELDDNIINDDAFISEFALTGEHVAEEAPPAAPAQESGPSAFDWLGQMFAQAATASAAHAQPEAWVVAIYRGEQCETVRFKNDNLQRAGGSPDARRSAPGAAVPAGAVADPDCQLECRRPAVREPAAVPTRIAEQSGGQRAAGSSW